jgi:apolipoprotein N-acyltransferase
VSAIGLEPRRGTRAIPMLRVMQTFVIGGVVALVAWYPGHLRAALLVMPWVWACSLSRRRAFVLWLGYYLVAARDIPAMCSRFFTGAHETSPAAAIALGVGFWLASSAMLAAPWGVLAQRSAGAAQRASRAMLATVLVTLPPAGFIGWVSPLHASSALYPGWGIVGLVLGLVAIASMTVIDRRGGAAAVVVLCGLALVANATFEVRPAPAGWVGLSTRLGVLSDHDYPALYRRTMDVQKVASEAFAGGATVVVSPESIAGPWRASTGLWWRDYASELRTRGESILLGVDITDDDAFIRSGVVRYADAVIALGASHGAFASRQPMPVGDWRPGTAATAVSGRLSQPFLVLGGLRVAMSICYEDMLWWPHWRMLIQRPDVVVSVANNWFIAGTALEAIQTQSIESVAQLVGRPLVRARNE